MLILLVNIYAVKVVGRHEGNKRRKDSPLVCFRADQV